MKRLIVFDLDGTLALSKSALDDEMASLLGRLMAVVKVAIISGGDYPQFEAQVLGRLPSSADLANLSLLPTSGTKFFVDDGGAGWRKLYSEDLSPDQKRKIENALASAVAQTGFQPAQTWGERIEGRGTQITYSALGQQAPLAEKEKWDPDFSKRKQIKAVLDTTIPNSPFGWAARPRSTSPSRASIRPTASANCATCSAFRSRRCSSSATQSSREATTTPPSRPVPTRSKYAIPKKQSTSSKQSSQWHPDPGREERGR